MLHLLDGRGRYGGEVGVDHERLESVARRVVCVAQPFASAWEFDPYEGPGDELYAELIAALGLTVEQAAELRATG